jgi:hypothetical protein
MTRGSRNWHLRIIGTIALTTVLGLSSLGLKPAIADSPVTVTSSGPATITTSSLNPTGRILATFTITDTSKTATGATICRNWGNEKKQGCRYQRFDGKEVGSDEGLDDEDWDTDDDDEYSRWDILGSPGQWTISYPIGFDYISREQCLTAAWNKDPDFFANIEVLNDAGVLLATNSFNYVVNCTGVEGGATSPQETRVYSNKSVKSKSFSFFVVDRKRVLKSYRICNYNWYSGKYYACDREKLTQKTRDDEGWILSYSLTFPAYGSTTCAYIGRKWPDAGFRVEFYDSSLDKVITLYKYTRLDC